MKDDSSNHVSIKFAGYKPQAPRESDKLTALEMRKLQDFILLLQRMKNKNARREESKNNGA